MIYVFNSAGECLEKNATHPAPLLVAFESNHGEGLSLKVYEADPYPGAALDEISATIDPETGEVTEVSGPTASPEVWLHVDVAGQDGRTDIPGSPITGALTVSAKITQDQEGLVPITLAQARSYRLTVRTTDGLIYDVPRITLDTNGEMASAQYPGTGKAAVCQVLENDFEQVDAGGQLFTVRLAAPVKFKFYQELI